MLEISQIGCGVYLMVLSVIDIWVKRLPLWGLAAGGIAALAIRILMSGRLDVLSLAGGAVGAVFMAVSKITKEALGYGDSLLIIVLGIYLGFWKLLGVLTGAFFLSALFAVAALAYSRFDRKEGYAFVPFLLISYFLCICLGGI